jgi:hypothetical protein
MAVHRHPSIKDANRGDAAQLQIHCRDSEALPKLLEEIKIAKMEGYGRKSAN